MKVPINNMRSQAALEHLWLTLADDPLQNTSSLGDTKHLNDEVEILRLSDEIYNAFTRPPIRFYLMERFDKLMERHEKII